MSIYKSYSFIFLPNDQSKSRLHQYRIDASHWDPCTWCRPSTVGSLLWRRCGSRRTCRDSLVQKGRSCRRVYLEIDGGWWRWCWWRWWSVSIYNNTSSPKMRLKNNNYSRQTKSQSWYDIIINKVEEVIYIFIIYRPDNEFNWSSPLNACFSQCRDNISLAMAVGIRKPRSGNAVISILR